MIEATPRKATVRARLEIACYPSESEHNERWFRGLNVLQIVTAAAIPLGHREEAAGDHGDAR